MLRISRVILALAMFAVLGLVTAVPTYADAVQLLFPSELSPGGTTLGYPGAPGSLLSSGFNISAGGNTLTFTTSNGNSFGRRNQIPPTIGVPIAGQWDGNFAPGTLLLWTRESNGPLDITFATGVLEIGFRAQEDLYGSQAFSFTAFNGAMALGTFSVSGISTDLRNDTALFLGVRSTGVDVITRIQVSSTTNNFAIGPVSFGGGGAEPIPEPATMVLLGTGLTGVSAALRRRRRAPKSEEA